MSVAPDATVSAAKAAVDAAKAAVDAAISAVSSDIVASGYINKTADLRDGYTVNCYGKSVYPKLADEKKSPYIGVSRMPGKDTVDMVNVDVIPAPGTKLFRASYISMGKNSHRYISQAAFLKSDGTPANIVERAFLIGNKVYRFLFEREVLTGDPVIETLVGAFIDYDLPTIVIYNHGHPQFFEGTTENFKEIIFDNGSVESPLGVFYPHEHGEYLKAVDRVKSGLAPGLPVGVIPDDMISGIPKNFKAKRKMMPSELNRLRNEAKFSALKTITPQAGPIVLAAMLQDDFLARRCKREGKQKAAVHSKSWVDGASYMAVGLKASTAEKKNGKTKYRAKKDASSYETAFSDPRFIDMYTQYMFSKGKIKETDEFDIVDGDDVISDETYRDIMENIQIVAQILEHNDGDPGLTKTWIGFFMETILPVE